MKIKTKIILLSLALANFAVCLSLLICCVPAEVPALYDLHEQVVGFASKWVLIIPTLFPLIIYFPTIFVKNAKFRTFLLQIMLISLFEHILFFSCFVIEKTPSMGKACEIPFSVAFFLPFAVLTLICSCRVKSTKYKSHLGFNFKTSRETEFLWVQTHIFARDAMFLTSLVMLILVVIFCFFRLPLIEFALFVLLTFVCILAVFLRSRSIYKTYKEMEARRERTSKAKKD